MSESGSEGVLRLVGVAGFVKGETFAVRPGESMTIGRSRSCSINLRNCPAYREVDPDGRNARVHFQTVSREHATVRVVAPDRVIVEDTSANGTFVDGERVREAALIRNLPAVAHELKLGTNESFRMEWHIPYPPLPA